MAKPTIKALIQQLDGLSQLAREDLYRQIEAAHGTGFARVVRAEVDRIDMIRKADR